MIAESAAHCVIGHDKEETSTYIVALLRLNRVCLLDDTLLRSAKPKSVMTDFRLPVLFLQSRSSDWLFTLSLNGPLVVEPREGVLGEGKEAGRGSGGGINELQAVRVYILTRLWLPLRG